MANVRRLALCGAAALSLLASACGSSSSSKSGAPTKAQYVAKADAICKAAGEKTAPLIAKLESSGASLASGSAKAARELAPVVEQLHTDAAASLSQLRGLQRPDGQHAATESFLSPLTDVVGAAAQAGSSLSAGQGAAALGLLAQVQTDAQQASSAARAYGVGPCGSVVAAIG